MKPIIEVYKVTIAFTSPLPLPEEELRTQMDKSGYRPNQNGETVMRVSTDGSQSIARAWEKGAHEAYYDLQRGFLSSEGDNFPEVAEGARELRKIASGLVQGSLDEHVKWAEINFQGRVVTKTHPMAALKRFYQDMSFEEIEKALGDGLRPFSLRLYSSDEPEPKRRLVDIPNWTHFAMEPLVLNPTYFLLRLIYRREKVEEVLSLADRLEETLNTVVMVVAGE
jgi:hypothetical protein